MENSIKENRVELILIVPEYCNFRAENAEMHRIREILIRDHEMVCRENERLQKKLKDLEVSVESKQFPHSFYYFSSSKPRN